MSGGHWNYLSAQLRERAEYNLSDVWILLAEIEHTLDWGICCDNCYECAKIQTINALESYFESGATSIEMSLRLLRSSVSECERCKTQDKEREARKSNHSVVQTTSREMVEIDFTHEDKRYRGTAYRIDE